MPLTARLLGASKMPKKIHFFGPDQDYPGYFKVLCGYQTSPYSIDPAAVTCWKCLEILKNRSISEKLNSLTAGNASSGKSDTTPRFH
jgi:hypothetical protein